MNSYQRRLKDIAKLQTTNHRLREQVKEARRSTDRTKEDYHTYVQTLETRIKELRQTPADKYEFVGNIRIDLNPAKPLRMITEISNLGASMKMRYMPRGGKANPEYRSAWKKILKQCPKDIISKYNYKRNNHE